MVSTSMAQREVRSLCKEILRACQHLPEGPTTALVRATSSKLTGILRSIWALCKPVGESLGRASKLHVLLVKNRLVPQMLKFLLWSLPLLPSELSIEPQGTAYHAWYAAADIMLGLAEFGSSEQCVWDEPAAGSALLEQLQPASDLSKPGEWC